MKIPFERTIIGAYRFVFGNLLSILGIGWFPLLVLGLVGAGLVYALLPPLNAPWTMDSQRPDTAQIMNFVVPLTGAILIFVAAALVAKAMVVVGVMRKALGQHPGPVFFFFSLSSQVWRMIGAYLLLMLLAWGAALALALGIVGVSLLLAKISAGVQGPVTTLLVCAAIVWGVYALVRVQFFLPAVVVAENHIGIRRSWHLGRGNFWRIVGIALAVLLPAGLVLSTINSMILQLSHMPELMFLPGWPPNPAHSHITPQELQRYFSALINALRSAWPYLAAAELLYVIVTNGLSAGAVANAYNLITGAPDTAPPSGTTKATA